MLLDIDQGKIAVNLADDVTDLAFNTRHPLTCRLLLNVLQVPVPFFHTPAFCPLFVQLQLQPSILGQQFLTLCTKGIVQMYEFMDAVLELADLVLNVVRLGHDKRFLEDKPRKYGFLLNYHINYEQRLFRKSAR